MINLQSVYVANGAALLLLGVLLISARKTRSRRQLDERLFDRMLFAGMLQCLMESAVFFLDGRPGQEVRVLLLVLNCLLYVNSILFAFSWTLYADYKLFEDTGRLRRRSAVLMVPAVVVIAGSVLNLFTPIFFRVTAGNQYQRTALFVVPMVLTYLYLLYGVVLIYRYRQRVKKYLFLPALVFMLPILLTSVLQCVNYGLSLIWLGVAVALVTLYVNVQNEGLYIDPLSGLYTRAYMNRYLEAEHRHSGSSRLLAGIMLDLDRFKRINDSFGHLVGDEAIRAAGGLLREAIPRTAVAIRFAGDEFVVLHRVETAAQVEELMQDIRDRVAAFNAGGTAPYQLSFSMGFSFFIPGEGDSVDALLNRMDAAMYTEKKAGRTP